MEIEVPDSEVLDRITILELKAAKLSGSRRDHAAARLAALTACWVAHHGLPKDAPEYAELQTVNAELWGVEDALRACEESASFGASFIELARSVYRLNDRRGAAKAALDGRVGSRWREVKGYLGRE